MKKFFQGRKQLTHKRRHIRFINKASACRKPLQTSNKFLHCPKFLPGNQIHLRAVKIHMVPYACHAVYRCDFQRQTLIFLPDRQRPVRNFSDRMPCCLRIIVHFKLETFFAKYKKQILKFFSVNGKIPHLFHSYILQLFISGHVSAVMILDPFPDKGQHASGSF